MKMTNPHNVQRYMNRLAYTRTDIERMVAPHLKLNLVQDKLLAQIANLKNLINTNPDEVTLRTWMEAFTETVLADAADFKELKKAYRHFKKDETTIREAVLKVGESLEEHDEAKQRYFTNLINAKKMDLPLRAEKELENKLHLLLRHLQSNLRQYNKNDPSHLNEENEIINQIGVALQTIIKSYKEFIFHYRHVHEQLGVVIQKIKIENHVNKDAHSTNENVESAASSFLGGLFTKKYNHPDEISDDEKIDLRTVKVGDEIEIITRNTTYVLEIQQVEKHGRHKVYAKSSNPKLPPKDMQMYGCTFDRVKYYYDYIFCHGSFRMIYEPTDRENQFRSSRIQKVLLHKKSPF